MQGVCKLPGGFTVFCERALPGERLRARVTAAKKGFAVARKLEALRQHSHAVEAPCQHFAEGCGGCSLQSLAYAAQLTAKRQQVRSLPPVQLHTKRHLLIPMRLYGVSSSHRFIPSLRQSCS